MYPFDLKNAEATRAEMLALKNNDAGECVCLLWCDDKSRVACKAAPPLLAFLSFGTQLLFSFLQCFWPCPFFFLQGPMLSWRAIIWIVLLNLHGATRSESTRSCNKRASLSAWLSFFLQHVGQHRSKNDHDEEIKSQNFYWSYYMTAAKGREESFKRWGKRRIHGIFCYRADCSTECLFNFFQVLLTWLNPLKLNTYFFPLQWVEKVTAQMMPSSSPLVKFWHGSLFVTSTVCMYDRRGTP